MPYVRFLKKKILYFIFSIALLNNKDDILHELNKPLVHFIFRIDQD